MEKQPDNQRRTIEGLAHQLTPVEIKNKEFGRTFWGYTPREVVEFLDATAKTWERVQQREKELLAEIDSLNLEIENWKRRETEIAQLKIQAESDARETRQNALEEAEAFLEGVREKANEIRGEMEGWMEDVIARARETEEKRKSFVDDVRVALDKHYELLKNTENLELPVRAKEKIVGPKHHPETSH